MEILCRNFLVALIPKIYSSSWKIVVSIFQMLRFGGMFPGSYRCIFCVCLIDPLFIAYCAQICQVDKLKRLNQMIEDDSKNIGSTDIVCHIQTKQIACIHAPFHVSNKLLKRSDNKVCGRWQLYYIFTAKFQSVASLRLQI